MERQLLKHLQQWLAAADRKPLVIRGARQVGKTWLVRHLAKIANKQLIEINLEKTPAQASLFNSNQPKQILLNLSAAYNCHINPDNSLLFIDEIQVVPELLSKLRWFAEDMPQLPVIAAGSLLEFVLTEHAFSMPVGRINYMHLEPLTFEEFLLAQQKQVLYEYLNNYHLTTEIPQAIHEQLQAIFKEYVLIGGLPAVVANWISERSLPKVNQIQHDLLATYREDFAKYKGRIPLERLDEVMLAVPKMLGQKFVYSRVNANVASSAIKQILNLFTKARICHRVWSCSANGVPLAADIKEKYFKAIFLDTGLCCTALGLNLNYLNAVDELTLLNKGALAEQIVGQLLRTINPPYMEPALYYWQREEKTSNAEIDYIIQHAGTVIPIEVKAGRAGTLKSLHLCMNLKNIKHAVRINSALPSKTNIDYKDSQGHPVQYQLLSLPFYLIGQLHRLLDIFLVS